MEQDRTIMLQFEDLPNSIEVVNFFFRDKDLSFDTKGKIEFQPFFRTELSTEIKNINLISLQKDLTNKERDLINNEINLIEFTETLDSDGAFLDTASIITNCNLIISVDTSIAHLAGILNKQVWVLLKKFPDWRWLLNRKTTPWYPNVTLFRQEKDNNWNNPIKDIYEHLLAKLEKK